MKKYFDGENALFEVRSAMEDFRKSENRNLYITIGVLTILAISVIGIVVYFLTKKEAEFDEYDDFDWDDIDGDCGCGCMDIDDDAVEE